eukprot:c19081_g1_i1 orf=418-1044(-)
MAMEGSTPSEEAIKEAVLEILQEADLEKTTEFKVRELASKKLGADLNQSAHKKLVRKVVGDYLNTRAEAEAPAHSAEEEEDANDPPPAAPSDDAHHDEGKPSKAQDESDDDDDNSQPSRFARKPAPPPKQQRKQIVGDDDDNLICQLSSKRNVSIQKFRGKTFVSIREYYEKDGELRPSAKGISLSVDQWQVLKNNVSAIERAVEELQ